MASSNPPKISALEKIIQDHLECSICFDQYTEPKVLECLHSFCKHCLQKYQATNNKDANVLICPECRQKTKLHQKSVQDLKTNFNLNRLAVQLEQVSSSENSKLICKLCEENNEAIHFCFDCPTIICANCYKMHQKIPASSSHTVATLKDISDGKIARKERKQKRHPECQTHEGEVMRFYCTTCDVMICRDCTVIQHCKPQHEYVDCNQASSTAKQSLDHLITPLKEILKNLEQSQATVSTMKDKLDIAVERTMAEVKNRADEFWAELKAQESCIMDEIKAIHKDRSKKLGEYKQTMSVNSQQIQQSLQIAEDVSNNSSAPDFLASYPTISKDLKVLRDQNQPKIDSTLSHLRFKPGVCDICLGNLTEPKWELCLEYDTKNFGACGVDASVPGDEIIVTYHDKCRVVIYDTKGLRQQILQSPQKPVAVAAFQNQFVVVGDSSSVKVYNKSGSKGFEFYTVPHSEVDKTAVSLWGVAVMKDTILVGDVKRSVITKHSSSEGSLKDTVSVKTKPLFLAIDSKDRVIVSGGNQQQVDIIDDNGATLVTIRPTINGQKVRYCNGVCCDSSAVYIVVHNEGFNTGHIHQYDTDGRFLSCIAQGLFMPGGISLTSDWQHLAVADWTTVKIFNKV